MDKAAVSILAASKRAASPLGLEVMQLSLLDWIAVGVAGLNEPVSNIMFRFAKSEAGSPHATLFGGAKAPARMTALVNGTVSHALDYDDTHFAHIGHPSVAVIPAAFAIAEMQNANLQTFLDAALIGCEASIRFGMFFGRQHYQVGFHQTATAGSMGAAVAASLLLSDDEEVHSHTLALVTTRAAGLKSQFGTMGKPFNAGAAASNGVEAAQLAQLGFQSPSEALTGGNGFLETHHCDGVFPNISKCLMETVRHKFHACCHGLHASLEALQSIDALDLQNLESLRVETHPRWMTVCNIEHPKSGLEAKFSYRTVLALSLLGYDTAALQTYSDDLVCNSDVRKLSGLVTVIANSDLSETQARLTVHSNGNMRVAEFDLEAKQSFELRKMRVLQKAAVLIGETKANELWSLISESRHQNVSDLTAFMK